MPECLEKFLRGVTDAEAMELWVWFDSNPYAVNKCIEIICQSHNVKFLSMEEVEEDLRVCKFVEESIIEMKRRLIG